METGAPTTTIQQPQKTGRTIFEIIGVSKEKSDAWWKILKKFMIFIIMGYFAGLVIDLVVGTGIFQLVLPIIIILFLVWKQWGKDLIKEK